MKINMHSHWASLLIIVALFAGGCSDDDSDTTQGQNPVQNPDPDQDPDPDPDPKVTCNTYVGANYIVFEAEATESPLGNWEIVKAGDSRFRNQDEVAPINGTHLEFTGNNISSGPADSPLEYKFKAPSTGVYRLAMRLYQRLEEGAEEDKSNDVYIRMAGDFTSATDDYTTDELSKDLKFFGRGVNKWGACVSGDGGAKHKKTAILYNFIEGKEYTFTMSGRSKNANIDYILFYDVGLKIKARGHLDLAEGNDPKFRPDYDCES